MERSIYTEHAFILWSCPKSKSQARLKIENGKLKTMVADLGSAPNQDSKDFLIKILDFFVEFFLIVWAIKNKLYG